MEARNDTRQTSRFAPATRQKAKLRMALTGVSGSGKTLGALYIGYGMTGDWSQVALIDTERERARMYAHRSDLPIPVGEFLHAPFYPPYSPQAYRDLVAEGAQAVGPDGVVIIDSFSHAWMGEGGILDVKDRIQASSRSKDGFAAWQQAGKEQTRLIDSILAANCHIICTMRSKMAYEVVEADGRKKIVKLGLEPVQRGETEYEFDVVLDIHREGHTATASKDVTFLDSFGEVITPELGQRLARWLEEGVSPAPEVCQECGSPIHGMEGRTAAAIVQGTLAQTGRKLCLPCFRRLRARSKASVTPPVTPPITPTVTPITPRVEPARVLGPVEAEYERRRREQTVASTGTTEPDRVTRNAVRDAAPPLSTLPWEKPGTPSLQSDASSASPPTMPNPPATEQLYILPPPRRA